MNLSTFLERRRQARAAAPAHRQLCLTCMQPDFSCFCAWLKPFDPEIDFVVLTHPIEHQRRIATGRMSVLSLKGATMIVGHDYTDNSTLNRILQDPARHCVMLYPGRLSENLTPLTKTQRRGLFVSGKRPTIIVVDGTWSTARKMVHLSQNLKSVKRICFTPISPSNFRVRQQPRQECYSTIEAIHHVLDLLHVHESRPHDSLLEVFDKMVNRQLELAHCGKPSRRKYY